MPTFALISEGKTDQVVLEYIIEEVCEDFFDDEIVVNFLQPLRDATDAPTAPHGGWELVFEYCQTRTHDALATNDFVVVQIDTDSGDHSKFKLHLTKDGKDRDYKDLVDDASAILKEKIGETLYKDNENRIIFAVAVHSIESWILLFLFGLDEPKGSFARLANKLRRANKDTLTKDVKRYAALMRGLKKKKTSRLLKK